MKFESMKEKPKRIAGPGFFVQLIKPHWPYYAVSLIFLLAANATDIFWVRVVAVTVERVAKNPGQDIVALALPLIALSILVFSFRWISRNLVFFAARRVERLLRKLILASALELSQEEIDTRRTGDIVSRIISNVSDIRLVVGTGFLQIFNNAIAYAATISMMVWLVPFLAATALVPFLPLFFVARYLTALSHRRSKETQEALGNLSSSVEETVAGIEVIKAYNAETWQSARFEIINNSHYAAERKRIWPEALFSAVMGSVVWIGVASILMASAWIVSRGDGLLSISDLTTFILLFAKLVWPTVALGWIMNVIQRGLAAADRVIPYCGKPPYRMKPEFDAESLIESGRKAPAVVTGGDVRFENVVYRYPTRGHDTLRGIDLTIKEGSWVAIVGPTASGKTTVARLISGLRPPTAGSVCIGQSSVYDAKPEVRKRLVHLATQVPTLFSMSIRENLSLAGDVADDDALRKLLSDAAFLGDLDRMPESLATLIGERGLLFSGGQRQRLSLARGLISDPEVLILDDIISAVDLETERLVLDGILRRRKSRTTIFITHRLSLLTKVNRVIVVERGKIRADGTLEEARAASLWLDATINAELLRRGSERERGGVTV